MTIYKLIGCMTGTSCDGLDIAYIITDGVEKIITGPAVTIPFDTIHQIRGRVTLGVTRHFMDDELSKDIANYHAKHIKEFIQIYQLEVDAIGFHGQTVMHDPKNGITVQLGDCQHLANQLGIKVVGQMRLNDVVNGGQGAPLAPIYHQAITAKLPKPTVVLNIGGITNLTYIDKQALIAGDIGPGNALIDDWMQTHTGIAQDTNGECAKKGNIYESRIEQWLQDPFLSLQLPKSLDRMYFHKILDNCKDMSVEDGAATLTNFTVACIVKSLELLPIPLQLVICGGGCHNQTLMNQLQDKFSGVMTASDLGYNTDAIESQLMAYLTARFFERLPSSFTSTTGVLEPTIAGRLFLPE